MMEENIFKSCLKRKVKFTTSTFIKFLITGTVALSLTACGGGGGGGGSSSSGGNSELPIKTNSNSIVFEENRQDTVVLENGYKHINTGEIKGTLKSEGGENKVAIKIENGAIENNGKVNLQGTNVTAFEGKNSEIKNTEDIIISGENARFPGIYKFTGISVAGNRGLGLNLGVIDIKNNSYIEANGKTINELTSEMSKGMYAKNGATIINDISTRVDLGKLGTIKIKGSTFGMLAEGQNSKAINKGKIELSGETTIDKVGSIGMGAISGANAVNEKDIVSTGKLSDAFGMITSAGKIENKGKIELNGDDLTGMSAILDKNVTTSSITNKGKINLSGTGDIIGIGATHITNIDEESPVQEKNIVNIESTGPITLNKTFAGTTTQIATGINVLLADGKINNSGEIVVNADGVLNTTTDFEDGIHGLQGIQAIGRETKDSNLVVENKGNITINDKTTGNNDLYIAGIEAWDADVNNSGNIKITSAGGDAEKEIYGIDNEENDYGSKVKNTGNIDITASNLNGSIVGISGSNIDNSGNINISTDVKSNLESSKYNVIAGIETYNRIGTDDININNAGDITIQSNDNDSFNNLGEYGILIEVLRTEENNAKGKIYNSGDITLGSGVGIFVNNCENDYTGQFKPVNIEVINDGNITISKNGVALEGRGKGVSILNKGNLILNGENSVGMLKETNSSQINEGNIKVFGKNSYGMQMTTFGKTFDSNFINRGTIEINDDSSSGMYIDGINRTELEIKKRVAGINEKNIIVKNDYFNFPNEGIEEAIKKSAKGMYVIGEGAFVINEAKGLIEVSGSSIGMVADSKGEAINNGTINLVGKGVSADTYMTAIGMVANGGLVTNNRVIKSSIDDAGGMTTLYGNATNGKDGKIILSGKDVEGITGQGDSILKNEGLISLKGQGMIFGMDGINDEEYPGKISIENSGKIQVIGDLTDVDSEAVGISVGGSGSVATNKKGGIITAVGHNAKGMSAETGATVTNYGEINVNGEDAKGMVAEGTGSTAINEIGGVINIGKDALTGMLADGGTAINKGTINIHKENLNNDKINTDAEGNPILGSDGKNIPTSGMQAWNDGTIKNEGTINTKGDFIITTDSTSAYIIGTNKDGSYGKVSAETVTVDGNVKVSAEMAKEGYKDSYALNNAIAGKTELGENYKLSSTSLLYNAVSKTDEEGNLDVELVINDTDISDLASKEISKVAGIFDSAMKDETLSKKEKEILEKVFDSTSSAKAVDDTIKEFTGYNVYSNIARQIFDTKDMFVSYDKSIIDSLGDYSFNFNFIGNYADVNSKNGTAGYDSKVTGINGAVRFTDSLYGVIGYGYNDVDYDGSSDGTIETIHTGIYKDIKSQFGDIRTGIFGEYNFHETDRKVFGEKADSDFNSYLIGANVEISRKFGDDLYIKPALSFDLSYGKYEDFKEDGGADVKFEKQDYVSAVPAIELKLGKEFETSEIYGAVKYSYELGDLNKEQEIELFEYREDFQADNIEDAQTDVKFGASFNIKNISVNAELGKEFGKRDREYVKAGFSYIF